MRAALCTLTFLTAFGACGDGTPDTITTFRLGPDGRPDMSTMKEQIVVVSRAAETSSGVAYTWDCASDASLFGGETKLFWASNYASSATMPCRGFGTGGNNVMQISLTLWNWPNNQGTLAWDVGSHITKGYDSNGGTHHTRVCLYRNSEGGNGSPTVSTTFTSAGGPGVGLHPSCWDPVGHGSSWGSNFNTTAPAMSNNIGSIDFTRWCGPGFTSC